MKRLVSLYIILFLLLGSACAQSKSNVDVEKELSEALNENYTDFNILAEFINSSKEPLFISRKDKKIKILNGTDGSIFDIEDEDIKQKFLTIMSEVGFKYIDETDEYIDFRSDYSWGNDNGHTYTGMKWLQFLPEDEHYLLTVMISESNKINAIYIDIIANSGVLFIRIS